MFSPTRTALYVALGALGFAATEANAGCKLISGTYVCASWIKGSEICEVTVDLNGPNTNFSNNEPDDVQVTCEVMGGTFFLDGGEGGPFACPTGELPPGDLTCSGGNPNTPLSPAPGGAPGPSNPNGWVIFGANGVNISGGSTGNGPVGSNHTIKLSGAKSVIFGDAYADAVNKSGPAKVTGATVTPQERTLNPVGDCTVPDGYSDGDGILTTGGASYSPSTGVLDLKKGSAVLVGGGTFCFSNVLMSGKSSLEYEGFTTVNMTGGINGSGQSQIVPLSDSSLEINSKGSSPFSFSGHSTGQNVRIYAPNADIKFSGGSIFSGSFVGKSVDISGGSAVNGTEPVNLDSDPSCLSDASFCATTQATCDPNGICTATAEVNPVGFECPNGGTVTDFTADNFLGHVQACDGGEGCENLWQYCTLNGNSYDCVDVPDPSTQDCPYTG